MPPAAESMQRRGGYDQVLWVRKSSEHGGNRRRHRAGTGCPRCIVYKQAGWVSTIWTASTRYPQAPLALLSKTPKLYSQAPSQRLLLRRRTHEEHLLEMRSRYARARGAPSLAVDWRVAYACRVSAAAVFGIERWLFIEPMGKAESEWRMLRRQD
jgi:hypothetical protein